MHSRQGRRAASGGQIARFAPDADRALTACLGALAISLIASPAARAQGFDLFGWFGSAPKPNAETLPYAVTIEAVADGSTARNAARDASLLEQLKDEPPRDGAELARRVEADLPRIVDALWARGHYAARVSITVGGASARIGAVEVDRIAAEAERARNRAVLPVAISIEPGPLYRLADPAVIDARTGRPFAPETAPARASGLSPGDPASTQAILAASGRISDRFREAGHPFVNVTRRDPVIDHRSRLVDLELLVQPGPVATFGPIAVTGAQGIDPAVIRSFIYTEPGDPYTPRAIAGIRKSVGRIEALSAVRVTEATALDGNGQLPLVVDVTERPPRLVGASARFSTVDGPALRAYWAHRNLFGGAERLRLDADLFYTVLRRDGPKRGFRLEDLGGRVSASFIKPALGGTRLDLLADLSVGRERTEAYDAETALATLAIRRRFTDSVFVQAGIEAEAGRVTEAPPPLPFRARRTEYGLVGLPLSLGYDDTDRPLDPTSGVRVTASAAPYLGFGDAARAFGIARIQASAYRALDAEARVILAARVGFGSVFGGSFDEIPATRRFYAGGGGSVRGFEYRSLSPRDGFGRLTGGRSLVDGSLEARIKITETIGIVPFVDVGQAYAGPLPDTSARLRVGAGLGLRYYTGIGPIRVDLALPLDRRKGENRYALYVGIGQAF